MAYNKNAVRMISGTATFASGGDGDGTSTYNFKDAAGTAIKIPSGALILGGGCNVITAMTSGGGGTTCQIKVGSTNMTTALGKAVYATNAGVNFDAVSNAAATGLYLTADANLTWTIASAALTAGVFHAYVIYVMAATATTI